MNYRGLLFLVLTVPLLHARHKHEHDDKAMKIDHELIRVVDAGQIDLIKLLALQRDIRALLEGDKKTKAGLIAFNGRHYTARQMVKVEGEHKGKRDRELQSALAHAFQLIQNATDGYMNEARGYKKYMKRIIKRWSEMRERPNTTLLDWEHQADGKEHEQLKKLIHNFSELELFLDDLSHFLADLSYSCTETWKKFEKQLKEKEL